MPETSALLLVEDSRDVARVLLAADGSRRRWTSPGARMQGVQGSDRRRDQASAIVVYLTPAASLLASRTWCRSRGRDVRNEDPQVRFRKRRMNLEMAIDAR